METIEPDEDRLLTAVEAARILGVSHDTVGRWCVAGELPWIDVGTPTAAKPRVRIRIARSALDRYLKEREHRLRQ